MKTIILLDSGYLKHIFKDSNKLYSADNIEKLIQHTVEMIKAKEQIALLRVLFYDCLPFSGSYVLPISKKKVEVEGTDKLMRPLSQKNLFAVRYGTLKFRGWILKKRSYQKQKLTDDDFEPSFEQKGVDMRIGLDISQYSTDRSVDHIILVSNDTDCIPAMKCARKNGLKMSLISYNQANITPDLRAHADEIFLINLPKSLEPFRGQQK